MVYVHSTITFKTMVKIIVRCLIMVFDGSAKFDFAGSPLARQVMKKGGET